MSELLPDQLRDHLDALVPARPAELREMEAYAREHDFPIIGPASGQLCYLVARMIDARRVFELGSGFGYSTAFFARAVQENGGGTVHHVVWDEELSRRARRHLGALGYDDVVRYHVGEAVEALRGSEGGFDLVFNDIDKQAYPDSLPVIEEKLRPGGVLIIDNMLWSGRIFDAADRTPATEGVREFTRRITSSPDWITSLVPIRDGLIVALRAPGAGGPMNRLTPAAEERAAILEIIERSMRRLSHGHGADGAQILRQIVAEIHRRAG